MSAPGTPTWLRSRNDRTAFRLFLAHGPLSRTQLGDLSGHSKPTAGQIIARLERAGLIEPVGEVTGSRGPNAVSYGVRHDSLMGVAISIHVDAIEAVVVDAADRDYPVAEVLLGDESGAARPRSAGADVRAAVDAATAAAGVKRAALSLAAISVETPVNPDLDELAFTSMLPGWPQVGARAEIERSTGLVAMLRNDVNLAAAAERESAAQDLRSFAFVWLGEGIGAGVDLDGRIEHGAFGSAGEVAFLEVPRSAAAMDPAARNFTDLIGGAAIRSLVGAGAEQRLRDVLPQLHEDETVLLRLAERVALLVAPIVSVIDPQAVILGGPTGLAGGQRLATLVQEQVGRAECPTATAPGTDAGRVAVLTSAAGDRPELRGARRVLVADIHARLEATIPAVESTTST